MFTTLYVPVLAKDVEIPHDESYEDYEHGELVLIEIEKNQKDFAYFKQIRQTPFNFKEVIEAGKILRDCTAAEKKKLLEQAEEAEGERGKITEIVQKLGLQMSLGDIVFSYDKKVLMINFTADARVDFRELVKILAGNYKKKIHLHQIGARDKARNLSGYGVCGRKLCCSNHLTSLPSVTMEAARDQNLAFKGAEALSGSCGKLKCCLNYESQQYKDLKKQFPAFGAKATIEKTKYVIIGLDILNGKIKLKSDMNYLSLTLDEFNAKKEKVAKK